MVESFLQLDETENTKLLAISRGSMKKISSTPPLRELLLFEKAVRESVSHSEIMDFLDEFRTIESDDLNYWLDWGKIIGYDRLKKLGFIEEAMNTLDSTSYVGYHRLKGRKL